MLRTSLVFSGGPRVDELVHARGVRVQRLFPGAGCKNMNGRHERIYRGYLVLIDVTRRDNDLVNVRISTRHTESGVVGPSTTYTEVFSLDLLGGASRKIRTALDEWLSDAGTKPASCGRRCTASVPGLD